MPARVAFSPCEAEWPPVGIFSYDKEVAAKFGSAVSGCGVVAASDEPAARPLDRRDLREAHPPPLSNRHWKTTLRYCRKPNAHRGRIRWASLGWLTTGRRSVVSLSEGAGRRSALLRISLRRSSSQAFPVTRGRAPSPCLLI